MSIMTRAENNTSGNTSGQTSGQTPGQVRRPSKSAEAKIAPTRPGKRSHKRSRKRAQGGAAGFGGGLASPRDRARVRERNAAERSRVEQVLASAPFPPTPLEPGTTSSVAGASSGSRYPELSWEKGSERSPTERFDERDGFSPLMPLMPRVGLRAVPDRGCPVCASAKVVSDEVMHGGTIRLSECLHCDHRWTERVGRRWSQLGATMARGARPRLATLDGAAR